ncbi:ABCF4, partial [Symbiodinium sp. CCMP2592]
MSATLALARRISPGIPQVIAEEFKRGHASRVRDREKEFKKQQEDKKAGKKQHPEEVVEKIKKTMWVKFRFLPPPPLRDDMGGISVHSVDVSYSGHLYAAIDFTPPQSVSDIAQRRLQGADLQQDPGRFEECEPKSR